MSQGIRLLSLVVACYGVASCASDQKAVAPDRAADESAIRANVAAYEIALNQRNGAALGSLYTRDGDLVVYDSPRVEGPDSIGAATGRDLKAWPATQRISIAVTSIRFINADVAIVETLAKLNEGEVRENRGTSVLVRQGGQWLQSALRVFATQKAG